MVLLAYQAEGNPRMSPNYVAAGAESRDQDAHPVVCGRLGDLSDGVIEYLVQVLGFRHADFQHPWGRKSAFSRRHHSHRLIFLGGTNHQGTPKGALRAGV